jgi:spore germination protein YaaH
MKYVRMKRLFTAIALLCLLSVGKAAFAAAGDIPVSVTFDDGKDIVRLDAGFYRGGDLWIPAAAVRGMGVPLLDGPNGKGFIIEIKDPAMVFKDSQIGLLAGNTLPLYFPSLAENGVSYFNVTGMERVTGLAQKPSGSSVTFRRSYDAAVPQNFFKPSKDIGGKLSIVWAHVTRDNPDISDEPKIEGLDVICPTWFNLSDGSGGMANRASCAYVKEAHKKGYRVWGLVSNGFSKTNTSAFFKDMRAISIFTARMLAYAKLYDLDGINIDFEGMDVNDRDNFVRFVAFIAPKIRAQGLTLSVDVFIPANSDSSRSHDRGAIAKYVDYVVLMSYDQHWRTSQTAGSVASMPWVEQAVQRTIAEGVPSEKLLLGVPFYMRRWEETPVGGGKVKTKAFTLTMPESDTIVRSRGLCPIWLNDLGQYFYSYTLNGKTYKVWVENEASIARKLLLVDKYRLAGVAAWRKGHEKPEVWNIIKEMLKKI